MEHADFFWVFVTRTFYYMCISLQAFGLFMLRDVQRVDDPTYFTSLLAMTGQLSAAIVAVPAGRLSDRWGRKPLVYASCLMMAVRAPPPRRRPSTAPCALTCSVSHGPRPALATLRPAAVAPPPAPRFLGEPAPTPSHP